MDGTDYEATRALVIATGTEPVVPPVPGLDGVDYWTNREAIEAKELPASIIVLGAGAVGAELAQAYLEVGLTTEAIQELRNGLRLRPQFADLRVRLGEVYQQAGDVAAAKYEFKEAIRVKPNYARAHTALGLALLVSGQRKKAIEEWTRA